MGNLLMLNLLLLLTLLANPEVRVRLPQSSSSPENNHHVGHGGGWCRTPDYLSKGFMGAISKGDVKTADSLTNANTNFNQIIKYRCNDSDQEFETTPLIWAVQGGHLEMVEYLLRHGAYVNLYPTARGSGTALYWAAIHGKLSIVRVLLKYGAIVDEYKDGETAFLAAASECPGTAVLRELIAAGADIHAVDNGGRNAVMRAAFQRNEKAVKLLVRLGVEACSADRESQTAIDLAKELDEDDPASKAIVTFLKQKCHQ
jgi:Ankyrin repeats (3 copies)/Ankyrin repeats (many copies)